MERNKSVQHNVPKIVPDQEIAEINDSSARECPHPDLYEPATPTGRRSSVDQTNNTRRSLPLPGVFRIPGIGSSNNRESNANSAGVELDVALPHAYPVDHRPIHTPLVYGYGTSTNTNTTNSSPVEDETRNSSFTTRRTKKICITFISSFLLIFILLFFVLKDKNGNMESEKPEMPTNVEETEILNVTSKDDTDKEVALVESNSTNPLENNIECYTDPHVIQLLEWDAFNKGEDPSIPRKYHFCPNTVMKVFGFDTFLMNFDYTTGDVNPLVIFRPNIHIMCGFDGDYNNNCTFSGGYFHIALNECPIFVNYDLNSTSENVTIEGFRFTGARGGSNILVRAHESSLTIKNCRFDNNYDMMTSINMVQPYMISSTLIVQNSTFDSNIFSTPTLYFDGGWKSISQAGVILALTTSNNSDITISTHVTDSLFFNNTFLLDDNTNNQDENPLTASIINVFPPVTALEITNSCFVENKGYSSGLILVSESEGDEVRDSKTPVTHKVYHGNGFIENTPYELSGNNLSCILLYQDIEINESIKVRLRQDGCGEYEFLNDTETNAMCRI